MIRPRSADDFLVIRERMEELRRERAQLSVEKGPLLVTKAPLDADNSGRAQTGRAGVPGWRVAPRRRPSSN